MISRQKLKYINSLQLKKYQKQEQKFLVEGEKSVLEILNSRYKINILLATKNFLEGNQLKISKISTEVLEVSEKELERTGSLKTNSSALAVVEIPAEKDFDEQKVTILPVFDGIQDPGNLGTIIRTCDWYGLKTIVLSENSVDLYNPKVIQASMGSFTRVTVLYRELQAFLGQNSIPVFGTSPEGDSLYDMSWPKQAIIVFGNESKGISKDLRKLFYKVVSIPKYGHAESLNVAIATAVVLDNLKRSEAGI
jgi:TrmH family RNA methyltransferase